MNMKHIVKYRESERGWGGEVWYIEFDNKDAALKSVEECNSNCPVDYVHDFYIVAEYIGELSKTPSDYKF